MSKKTELAWAAGFFDGEGCFSIKGRRRKLRLSMSITQVDRRPLDRFVAAIGYGLVAGPYQPPSHRGKPYYGVYITGEAAEIIAEFLSMYLGEPKKEQLQRVLAEINKV